MSEAGRAALQIHPRPRVVEAIRRVLAVLRTRILQGEAASFSSDALGPALVALGTPGLRSVLNATGVVLHTNLGRAPLAPEALARVGAVARGYSNLELDLESGERGSRFAPLLEPLRALTGAEDAIVVNNCAAATLLVLTALAEGREVVVSRGELVEIGGGFRIPDVMRQSHATLVEVGTTNRTRRADYERALSPATALVAKVHRSNFALVGFTEEATVEELARLCQPRGVPLFVDAGSGLLAPLDVPGAGGRAHDARPRRGRGRPGGLLRRQAARRAAGGHRGGACPWISRLRAHPLARALRVDKLTVAALEATLRMVQDGRGDEVPARALALAPEPVLRERAPTRSGSIWPMPGWRPGWSTWRDRWVEGRSRWRGRARGPVWWRGRPRRSRPACAQASRRCWGASRTGAWCWTSGASRTPTSRLGRGGGGRVLDASWRLGRTPH